MRKIPSINKIKNKNSVSGSFESLTSNSHEMKATCFVMVSGICKWFIAPDITTCHFIVSHTTGICIAFKNIFVKPTCPDTHILIHRCSTSAFVEDINRLKTHAIIAVDYCSQLQGRISELHVDKAIVLKPTAQTTVKTFVIRCFINFAIKKLKETDPGEGEMTENQAREEHKTPIVLLVGFLGAGKWAKWDKIGQ